MPTSDIPIRLRAAAVILIASVAFAGCSSNEAPAPQPAHLDLLSGDAQYTRKGTQLEDPVIVRVRADDGKAASGVTVHFQVIEGGGSLSRSTASTGSSGETSVKWTMGPATGSNRLRISVDGSSLSVVATATSSEYYCVEEDPTFVQKFADTHNLMMLTRYSSLTGGDAGLVRYPLDTQQLTFDAVSFQNFTEGAFDNVVRDCAFSANGDLFISWNHIHDEIVKVATDGSISHFATLEPAPLDATPGAELAMTPRGVLVGCDAVGPFYVTCRDTLFRFEDAIFTGSNLTRDAANNDALACDPASGDVYFIYKQDRYLYRVPFDGTTAGAKQQVVQLPIAESDGAHGMVVDKADESIYILVDNGTEKSIVKVTSAGAASTLFDLTTLHPADPGVYSDLAIDRQFHFLYTLDTRHNVFVLCPVTHATDTAELTPAGDGFSASNGTEGERVGLDVLPGAGP